MAMQTNSDVSLYEKTLIGIIQKLPAERIRQIIDFARFIQTQTSAETTPIVDSLAEERSAGHVVRRRPHPAIAGKGRTIGDIVSPIVDEADWECLK